MQILSTIFFRPKAVCFRSGGLRVKIGFFKSSSFLFFPRGVTLQFVENCHFERWEFVDNIS